MTGDDGKRCVNVALTLAGSRRARLSRVRMRRVSQHAVCDHRRSALRATCAYVRVNVLRVRGADECVRDVRCQVNAVSALCGISAAAVGQRAGILMRTPLALSFPPGASIYQHDAHSDVD